MTKKPWWTPAMILSALEVTAVRRSGANGHRLGPWKEAKRKLGKGAKKAVCMACGKQALLTPNGYSRGRNKAVHDVPGIRGEAVFETCDQVPELPLDDAAAVMSGRFL